MASYIQTLKIWIFYNIVTFYLIMYTPFLAYIYVFILSESWEKCAQLHVLKVTTEEKPVNLDIPNCKYD
jgi:hypothetical protein